MPQINYPLSPGTIARNAVAAKYPIFVRDMVAAWSPIISEVPKDLRGDRHGTLGGTGSFFSGGYWTFNGSDDSIDLGDTLDIGLLDMSVSLWMRAGSNHFSRLMSKNPTATAEGWFIGTEAGGGLAIGLENTFGTHSATYNDSAWHHVVGTWDRDGDAQVYFDGAALSTATDISSLSATDVANATPCSIGSRDSVSAFFTGDISDVLFWYRVLRPVEVRRLYNLPRGEWARKKPTFITGTPPAGDTTNNLTLLGVG